jgi:hypothetical protein
VAAKFVLSVKSLIFTGILFLTVFCFFLRAQSTTPLKFFTGIFGCWRDRARFLTFTGFVKNNDYNNPPRSLQN